MYILENCHGAPQCGCEALKFDTLMDLENYLEKNPDVMDDIDMMNAFIKEVV